MCLHLGCLDVNFISMQTLGDDMIVPPIYAVPSNLVCSHNGCMDAKFTAVADTSATVVNLIYSG